jgi:hypothetical protein
MIFQRGEHVLDPAQSALLDGGKPYTNRL